MELDNLFEAAEGGKMDLIRLLLQSSEVHTDRKPWLPAKIDEVTPVYQRTALHACVLGAIKSIARAKQEASHAKELLRNTGRTNATISNVSKAQEEIGKTEKKFALCVNFLLQKSHFINDKDKL